jgi:iron complex outermembrane receptor protein
MKKSSRSARRTNPPSRATPMLAALGLALAMPAAHAADPVPADPDAAPIAQVNVSAQRTRIADDAQRTPTAAYRVSGDQLEQQRVESLADLQQLVPGLNVQSTDPSDTQISIRGVGDGGGQASGDANIGMPSSVALYLDNVYLARPGMLAGNLGDLEYAEVLSGAQGTMFGANSTGGVVDLHTRAPSFSPEGAVSVSAGQRGYVRTSAMLSGPLSEDWAGRLNVIYGATDGNVHNAYNGDTLNGTSSVGLRGQTLYKPNSRFSLRLSADYSNINNNPQAVLVASHAVGGVNTFLTHSALVGNVPSYGSTVNVDDENHIHILQGGLSAEADWLLDGGYKLRSVSSYRYFSYLPNQADSLSVDAYANSGTQILDRTWLQDFRLDSPKGAFFDYATGITYMGQNMATLANTRYGNSTVPVLYYGNATYKNLDVIRVGTLHDASISPFFQGTVHAAPKLDIIAGVRVNYDEKGGQFIRYNKAAFNSGYLKEYNTLPSGTLTFQYAWTPQWQNYLALSYGEKAGGLNISAGAAAKAGLDSLYVKPERDKSAELGIKGDLFNHAVTVKADLFYTLVSDFQTQGYDVEDQQTYLMNAGAFRSRGAEASLHYAPSKALTVDFSTVFNDARYMDYATAACAPELTLGANAPKSCNLTGQRVFNAPRLTYNTSARYNWISANGLTSYVSGRYAYRSEMFGTVDNSQFTKVAGYGLAAFSAGVGGQRGAGRWDASVWVNNAFNRTYYTREVNSDYGSVLGWLGQPRTFGATLSYKF